ncbi:MAG: ABC transporter permease [Mycobacteriales bacterium]
MSPVLGGLRAFEAGAMVSWADLRVVYSWQTWTFGWLVRIVCQVVFYAVIGRLLGSADDVARLFTGAAVMAAVTEVMLVCASTSWERMQGTLPILVTAPGGLTATLAGRSVLWLPSGLATSLVCLFAVGPFFHVRPSVPDGLAIVALLVVGVLGTYAVGLVLAGLVLWTPDLRNLVSSVAVGLMTACCGALVPMTYWPGWVQGTVQTLPVTHALTGIHAARAGTLTGTGFLGRLGLAAGTGALWLALSSIVIGYFASVTRRTGRYELG